MSSAVGIASPRTGRPLGRLALFGLLMSCSLLVFGVIVAYLATSDGEVVPTTLVAHTD